jgi:hypothetical protein
MSIWCGSIPKVISASQRQRVFSKTLYQRTVLGKVILIALLATFIRVMPMLVRTDVAYAFPGRAYLAEGQQVIAGEAPWRNKAIHDDSFEYLQLADGLKYGCGFARLIASRCQSAEILRTPGYPLFLSTTTSLRSALALQVAISSLGCVVLALCMYSRWGIEAALTAEILVALDIPSFVLVNQMMAETLFAMFLLIASVPALLAIRRRRCAFPLAIISGLSAAFAILVRPIGMLLPLCIPIPFLFADGIIGRRRVAIALVSSTVAALGVLGWSARNYEVAGYPGVSTIGAINLYFYRAANIVAREGGKGLEATRSQFENELGVTFENVYTTQSPDLARRLKRLAFHVLLAHPFEAALMTVQGTAYLALFPIRSQLASVIGTKGGTPGLGLNAGAPNIGRVRTVIQELMKSPLLAALEILQVLMIGVVWIGIGRAFLRCRHASEEYRVWVLYLAGLSILLLVLAAGGEADVRFRAPVASLLAAVAGLGYFAERSQVRHVDEGFPE